MILEIQNLDVYYGRAHALQGVSLALDRGVLAVVGRNGMGKTTLCNAVTGLVRASGSVKLAGEEILGLAPNVITTKGVGYVPQGRRVWPSLSVDEHLRLARRRGPWTVERIYQTFPRLAERKANGGAELSGGEQQMLAISRALLFNPKLLVMDEPTEGLAPIIVQQVEAMLKALAAEGEISVLLIEQNLGVAIDVADTVDVMVNGRIARSMPTAELAADRDLQQRLLGVKMDAEIAGGRAGRGRTPTRAGRSRCSRSSAPPTPWWSSHPRPAEERDHPRLHAVGRHRSDRVVDARAETRPPEPGDGRALEPRVVELPVAQTVGRAAYIAGTFDTKGRELFYLRTCLERLGRAHGDGGPRHLRQAVAGHGPSARGGAAPSRRRARRVHRRPRLRGDRDGRRLRGVRGPAARHRRPDLGGRLGRHRARHPRHAPPAHRRAQGDGVHGGLRRREALRRAVRHLHDVLGHRRRGHQPHLGEGARQRGARAGGHAGLLALPGPAGGAEQARPRPDDVRPDHARASRRCASSSRRSTTASSSTPPAPAGRAWRSSPTPACSPAVLDLTTTEVADEIVGGVLTAGPSRLDVFARTAIPYVGSCGALDMVNFWARPTVPERFKDRNLHVHNPNVTLMRTTPDEAARIGRFIVDKLNRMEGPVRFLIPEGGLSGLDRPGGPFWDPAANTALFDVIASNFRAGTNRKLIESPEPHQRPRVRRRGGRHLQRDQDRMARIDRQDILTRLCGMVRRGEPIIGGGAGTGLSAKCEEAGGIDLIVIYNSGRYRMAGRGSLAGLLAYGNANEIVLDMAREVLPVVRHTPVLAGVNGTDPFLLLDPFLKTLGELGFSGVQNFPTVGLFDGVIRAQLEETGHGLRARGAADRARPRASTCSPRPTCSRRRTRATWPGPAPTSSSATSGSPPAAPSAPAPRCRSRPACPSSTRGRRPPAR